MKDEIKEILSKMERLIVYGQYNAYYDLEKQLLDHITNLQEELEEEKRIEQEDLKTIQNLEEENKRYKHYVKTTGIEELMVENERLKETNKKAIEYIKNDLILTDGFMIYEDGAKELLNILQGEDNSPKNLYKYTPEKGFRLVGDDKDE